MPTSDKPPMTRAVVLRGIGFAAAIALGAVAGWLVVTGDDQRTLRIGMLIGLWGLVLGAYSMFGARRGMGVEADDDPGRQIALREARQLERQDDADARRDWESRLERLISREVSTAIGRETAALRNEIAHLRQELLDKVGGQLRLERIETTRVIGSDLEALQHEVRQLKDANGRPAVPAVRELLAASNDPRLAVRPVVEPARVRPVSRPTAEVEADVRPAVADAGETAALRGRPAASPVSQPAPIPTNRPATVQPTVSASPPAPRPLQPPLVPPATAPTMPAMPAAALVRAVEPNEAVARVHRPPAGTRPPVPPVARPAAAPGPASNDDPFAALPRLSRFTDIADETPTVDGHAAAAEYSGRRRRPDDESAPVAPAADGRHSDHVGHGVNGSANGSTVNGSANGSTVNGGTANGTANGGGRRRRHDESDDSDDLLSRLLSRDSGR